MDETLEAIEKLKINSKERTEVAEVDDSEGRNNSVHAAEEPSLSQEQKQKLYLSRQLYNYYVNIMEDTKNTYVARGIRDYFVTLLQAAKADCKELIAFLKLPTSQNPYIDVEKRKIMLQHLKRCRELIVDDGEKEANKFLLNNGFMNPKLAQFFAANMQDDRRFSYPLLRVAPSKISIRGSMEEDEFYKRLNLYAEPSEYQNFIQYRKSILEDQKFKYGDRFSSNDHHSADKFMPLKLQGLVSQGSGRGTAGAVVEL